MKNIDIKSLLIGTLLASTIFLGVAAVGKPDSTNKKDQYLIGWSPTETLFKYDGEIKGENQVWPSGPANPGWQPFAVSNDGKKVFYRIRK